jgi:hypothetical protein
MSEGGTYPASRDYVCTDIRAWRDQVRFPDLDACDWAGPSRNCVAVDRTTHLVCGCVELTLFERSYLLMGLENALMAYMTDTEEMSDLLGAVTDFNIEVISRLHEAAHLDMVWYGDDWGSQEQLFLPPDIWRATVGKHTRRVYAAMKERGIIINQHSCGRIESVLPDVIEMGADIWNPCQPCNDLAGLRKRFDGRITFCGGIDSQHVLDRPGVTPREVRAEVRKRIDELADGGGYIAAPSHSVRHDPLVIDAMNDEIERYGRAYYAGPLSDVESQRSE